MAYAPQPGTAAYRIVGWLEAQGRTKEFNSAQIAYALHLDAKGLPTQLAPALQAGIVFRRQKDGSSPRAPFWYSLTDHGAVHRREFRPSPKDWMLKPGSDVDASAGPPASDGAASEGTADTPGFGQPEAAPDTPAPGSQQVLKAEAARPDATDRETPDTASPGVGPMGAGQPADAGPTTDVPVFITEQRREVDAQFAASLRAAMNVDVDDDCLARGAELGRKGDQLPPADLAATRRAVHAPRVGLVPHAFRAGRFSDGSLHLERDGAVIASLSAAEVDVVVQLLGARA